MRTLVTLALLLCLGACGEPTPIVDPAAQPQGDAPPAAPATETSPLIAPVAAPLQARDRLLDDLGTQKSKARDREAQLDSLMGNKR